MTRRNLGKAVTILTAALLLASAGPAFAAYFYDWSSAQKVTDSVGDAGGINYYGRDIVAAYQAYSNGYLYFRIDLQAAPSNTVPPSYAQTYGLYIDSKPTYGAPGTNNYVPGTLSGIDFIISSDLTFNNNNARKWDKESQTWVVNSFTSNSGLQFQADMNDGTTLEWKMKDGDNGFQIGNSFTWWAATMLPGDSSTKQTYDITNATVTPIPNAAWLLGSGVIALIGLKRRKRKTA